MSTYSSLPRELQVRIVELSDARTRLRLAATDRRSRSLVAHVEARLPHLHVQHDFELIDFVRFVDVLDYLEQR